MLLKANSSSCGRSTPSAIESVGRSEGMTKDMQRLKKGRPQSIRWGNTV